jgi:tetratricopeptide (TPR) repeat protein
MIRLIAGALLALVLTPTGSPAQAPEASRDIVATVEKMRVFTQALGVTCAYCHVERPDGRLDYRANDNPRKQFARDMIAMTNDVNTMVRLSRPAATTMKVDCLTCHRGVAIPRQLTEIVRQTVEQQGGAAAAEQYRTLRKQYYGRQSYDFSEEPLLSVIQGFIDGRPDDAIALLQMNLEFHPTSSRSYSAIAYAYTRKLDDAAAMLALEKALEIDPNNGIARGQLEQLKKFHRR